MKSLNNWTPIIQSAVKKAILNHYLSLAKGIRKPVKYQNKFK